MLTIVHVIVGAAIGKFVLSWPIALALAVGSHFVLDALPHADPGTLKPQSERGSMNLTDLVLASIDLAVAFGILLLLVGHPNYTASVFAGMVGGILPDVTSGGFHLFPTLKTPRPTAWLFRFHRGIQGTVDKKDWLQGSLVEFGVAVLSIILFLL